ncbi:PqqD family protein [Desulfococcaceae bacterium HSG9]|nr:PqqD family protein [Desulfococcaceae bacterium HSG9]
MNRLSQLTVNDKGFVFNPSSGDCFTANTTGLAILSALKKNKTGETIAQEMTDTYAISRDEAEKGISDFMNHLRIYKLLK